MELLIFGHSGAPVLVFPTSHGRFYEYEDRGMVGVLSHHVDQGWIQLICVDSVYSESWYNYAADTDARMWREEQYEHYLITEVLPLVRHLNPNPFLIATGCSFGASEAVIFTLRHPGSGTAGDRSIRVIRSEALFHPLYSGSLFSQSGGFCAQLERPMDN
jgi:esterase/lipase superfamily enzyme